MKKYFIGILSCVLALAVSTCPIYAVGSVEVAFNSIDGCEDCELEEQEVTMSLIPSGQYEFTGISVGDDVTDWFTDFNGTYGFNQIVTEVNTETIKIEFDGIAPSACKYKIDATIPEGHVNILGGIPVGGSVSTNSDSEGELVVHDYSEFIIKFLNTNAQIVGEVGKEIVPQSLYIQIEDFTMDVENSDDFAASISSYVFPTINGLVPSVKYYDEIDTIEVEFTGTPLKASNDQIVLTIPKSQTANEYCAFIVSDPNVTFNIVDNTIEPIEPEPPVVFEIPVTGVN